MMPVRDSAGRAAEEAVGLPDPAAADLIMIATDRNIIIASTAAALAAVAVFWLTGTFLAPADRLSAAAPADAVFYLHAPFGTKLPGGDHLPFEALGISALPNGVRPHDIAFFAVPTDTGVDWGAAVGWPLFFDPTPEDDRRLKEAGWDPLTRRVYATGPAAAAARAGAANLFTSKTAKALSAVADLLPIQGFVAPADIPADVHPFQLSFVADLEPVVFGMDRNGGSDFLLLFPVSKTADIPGWLGFAVPNRTAEPQTLPPTLENADIAVRSDLSVFDPLNVLVMPVERTRAVRQVPPSEEYAAATSGLRALLAGPVAISMFTDEKNDNPDFVATFPTVPASSLQEAITSYLSAALPEREIVSLPDQDISVELRVDPKKYRFVSLQDPDLPGAAAVSEPESGLRLIVAAYGDSGSSFATSEEHLRAILVNGAPTGSGRCAVPRGASSLDIRIPLMGYDRINVFSYDDKLIFACGYSG
jgi:hypothetical protein